MYLNVVFSLLLVKILLTSYTLYYLNITFNKNDNGNITIPMQEMSTEYLLLLSLKT